MSTSDSETTNPALSAKAKTLVLSALTTYRDEFAIARDKVTDEDEIAELDNDIGYTDTVIREVKTWKVKPAP